MSQRPNLLTDEEIAKNLESLEGWERQDKKIQKTVKLKNFKEASFFMNAVAFYAEAADHHPDIVWNYNIIHFTLSTHDQGGLTQLDFDLAQKIDSLSKS